MAAGERAIPLPVSLTVCGLPTALSLIVRVPVRAPVLLGVVGVKITLMVQLAPADTLDPQLFD